MKSLLIAITLALVIMSAPAWAVLPNANFDMAFTDGVAYGWNTYVAAGDGFFGSVAGVDGGQAQAVWTSEGCESGVWGQFTTRANFNYTISVWVKSTWAGCGNFAVDWNGGTSSGAINWISGRTTRRLILGNCLPGRVKPLARR